MGHDSTAKILLTAGADRHVPRGLFRNIWDPDELSKLVQTSEKCANTLLGRDSARPLRLELFFQAAAQFKKMGQRSSAEEMLRRMDEELEERQFLHVPPHYINRIFNHLPPQAKQSTIPKSPQAHLKRATGRV